MKTNKATKEKGFSLIELMIAIVVIAIMAGIAMNSYQDSVIKTKRKSALSSLHILVGDQEDYFVNNKGYATDLTDIGYSAVGALATPYYINDNGDASTAADGSYKIYLSVASTTNFTITAAPINSQANDSICGTLTLSSTGTKTISGTGSIDNCFH